MLRLACGTAATHASFSSVSMTALCYSMLPTLCILHRCAQMNDQIDKYMGRSAVAHAAKLDDDLDAYFSAAKAAKQAGSGDASSSTAEVASAAQPAPTNGETALGTQ